MIILKKNEELILLFINDIIATYNLKHDKWNEYEIPQNQEENRKVISACVSRSQELIAVALSNKQLIVFNSEIKVVRSTVAKRAVSKISFTNEADLVIADKTGDVFVYKFKDKIEPVLLLGHLSMLLDIVVSECGKYIVTSDRDEKIRVSCYPNAYNIVSFCLGHSEFVTHLKINRNVLISAAGDGTVRFWNYLSGDQLAVVNTNEHITNKALIENFCKEMSEDCVDVAALPVIDMQIYDDGKLWYVGVTVMGLNGVQLYTVNMSGSTLSAALLQTIYAPSLLLAYYLSKQLIIFTPTNVLRYTLDESKYEENTNTSILFGHCKDLLKDFVSLRSNDISTLYKRTYDNVQDYFDKKKMRLENKS